MGKINERAVMTNNLRSRVIRTADKLEQEGKGLLAWARENPSLFWTQLYKAAIPKEVQIEGELDHNHKVELSPALKEMIESVRGKSKSALDL